MAFYVGQKVVYLTDDNASPFWGGTVSPSVGHVYTVRALYEDEDGAAGLLVNEIRNPLGWGGLECGFFAWRFRPVVERKTDISIFKAMLNPSREEVSA